MGADFTNIFLYHSLIISGEILVILVLFHMLYKKRPPAVITAWLLAMILIPYITVLVYFIFGFRKRKNRYQKENITIKKHTSIHTKQNPINEVLKSHNISDAVANKNFKIFTDSSLAYDEFINSIYNAKTSIYISTYHFSYDKISKSIIEALVQKAKDGVEIKILIDSLGSIKLYLFQNSLKELKESGAKIEFFMPIFRMPFRNYINLRNHRKIFIFDNQKVLSGGMNISSDYFGNKVHKSRWEDLFFLVEGSSVVQYLEIFKADWSYASQEKLNSTCNTVSEDAKYDVQVVPSGPDMKGDAIYEALLCAIYNAKKRIWIVTPYFIPDNSILQALIIAKHKGLDVKLITPKETNHFIINLARASYIRELASSGADVCLYNGAMLHAKAILFDSSYMMLGSVNLDNRSLFLNYEVATFVYSKEIIDDVELWMNKLIDNSSVGVAHVSPLRRILENTINILAPQL